MFVVWETRHNKDDHLSTLIGFLRSNFPAAVFVATDQFILNFIWKCKGTQTATTILKKSSHALLDRDGKDLVLNERSSSTRRLARTLLHSGLTDDHISPDVIPNTYPDVKFHVEGYTASKQAEPHKSV